MALIYSRLSIVFTHQVLSIHPETVLLSNNCKQSITVCFFTINVLLILF